MPTTLKDVWSFFKDGWEPEPKIRTIVEIEDTMGRLRGTRVTVDDIDIVVISAKDLGPDFVGSALFLRSSSSPYWAFVPQREFGRVPQTPKDVVARYPGFGELFEHLETID
jgi:hypothetical protein